MTPTIVMKALPVLLFLFAGGAAGSRILLMPLPWPSVVNEFSYIGAELVSRGHEVHILLSEDYGFMDKFTKSQPEIKVITYATKYPDLFTEGNDDPTQYFELYVKDSVELDLREDAESGVGHCQNVLEDEVMEQQIKEKHFDVVLLSGFPETRCYFVLPYRLDIPYISVTTEIEAWVTRNPALPSFVPIQLQVPPLTPEMDFWQRLRNTKNLVSYVLYVDQIPMSSDDMVTKYAPNKPPASMNYVAGLALLWLNDNDMLIDFARPMMPNEINIGGLSVQPAKPLPQELQTFVSSAKEGVIVATFGSMAIIPEYIMLKIIDGLKMLSRDYHIIVRWHLPTKPDVPENILLMEYVPQSDILAHPNTKLFVTHAGANGHFEALSRGVPMVNLPVFYDQIYNAKRADYHGFSKTLDLKEFRAQELCSAIQDVLSDKSYKEKISHASAIFHSQPMSPRERAAFWVEHVIKYGGQHLRAHALDMPAYQYLMLDIAAFILVVFVGGLWITWLVFKAVKKIAGF